MNLPQYLAAIQKELALGNSTEHTHRPALKNLLESLSDEIIATNEPQRISCGAPDFIIMRDEIPIGYVEAKDIGVSLDRAETSEQLDRYRESLGNLILTDYLEFRWYVRPRRLKANEFPVAEHRLTARLARMAKDGRLRLQPDGEQQLNELLNGFLSAEVPTVQSPKELAIRMAALARLIRHTILRAVSQEDETGSLHQQMEGFREVLVHDLTQDQFADMYAQTICYGLFAARCNVTDSERFTREHAAYDLPKTNPFLRKMFNHVAGPDLDDRIAWAVDDIAELLNRADIDAILADFGKRTRREDPVVHFYETFLAAYDPKMREARGVYYTPEPVVSYIVRSIDHILKTDFRLTAGLADSSQILIKTPGRKGKTNTHRVLILDPATGTGTFLFGVINLIFDSFKKDLGMWPGYVSDHLLPRLFGFELLMAPYAVAHMKLSLQLEQTGYDFRTDERLRVYLTNTLEEAHEVSKLPLFTQWLADEANEASKIKEEAPVMVVLGNPPYSGHSVNVGTWIVDLLKGTNTESQGYFEVDGRPLGEVQVKWLHDDYVKFIRFAQWRIEQTGYGVLAFINNHGYLDNPTFRGMRQSLMNTFDDIYLLDLHGSSKKKEAPPDGLRDENVFDIQQGVAIGLFVKRANAHNKPATVRHAELWGVREVYEENPNGERVLVGGKYKWLSQNELSTTEWERLEPESPYYLFIPIDARISEEYKGAWRLRDILPQNSVGIVTARDRLTIHFSSDDVLQTVRDFIALPAEEARVKYQLGDDARDWKVEYAQADIRSVSVSSDFTKRILYRPFDSRFTYYTGQSRGFIGQPQQRIMRNMLAGPNLGLITSRSVEIGRGWEHVFCSSQLIQHHTVSLKEVNYLFPLYIYSDESGAGLFADDKSRPQRVPNISSQFVADVSSRLTLSFTTDEKGDLISTFGPEDLFNYLYAVLHAPTYRSRYSEFLKLDFPRLPITSNTDLFRNLCDLGSELSGLHSMQKHSALITNYPVAGDNRVDNVLYTSPAELGSDGGRVWVNPTQYFEGVSPEVWDFHIGGYQVCERWLKDRRRRNLTYDDLTHYQQIVSAVSETLRLMAQIDGIIDEFGGWPLS